MEAIFNRISAMEFLVEGMVFRKHREKREYYLPPITGLLNFEVLGGWRLGPYFWYSKRFKNQKFLDVSPSFSVGLKNGDLNYNFRGRFLYDPISQASFFLSVNRGFQNVFPQDAFLNQLRRSNYVRNQGLSVGHSFELFNGFYLFGEFSKQKLRSATDLDSETFLSGWLDDEDIEPFDFDPFDSFTTRVRISYTHNQKYIMEPRRKVVLGSDFPKLSLEYKKGWKDVWGSDIDYDYVQLGLSQNLILGTMGTTNYNIQAGKFLNAKDLPFVDYKRFRAADPFLFSEPLGGFQSLDTTMSTTDVFVEGHFIHHFNGALVNNLPLVKLLKIRVAAGGGFLWIKENGYRHEEAFAGIERIFKIGKRRRLRIGAYGIVSNSKERALGSDFKIMFEIIDKYKKNWDY